MKKLIGLGFLNVLRVDGSDLQDLEVGFERWNLILQQPAKKVPKFLIHLE